MKKHYHCVNDLSAAVSACGRFLRPDDMTLDESAVTCKRCMGTDVYQENLPKHGSVSMFDPNKEEKANYDGLRKIGADAACRHHQDAIAALTTERGKEYGKPIEHFHTSQQMYEEWRDRAHKSGPLSVMDIKQQNAVHHGVRLIIDKLVRAAESPTKKDHWDDIQGYARCVKNALGLE